MDHTRHLFNLFLVFSNSTNLTTNNCIQYYILYPLLGFELGPLDHESPPITTKQTRARSFKKVSVNYPRLIFKHSDWLQILKQLIRLLKTSVL